MSVIKYKTVDKSEIKNLRVRDATMEAFWNAGLCPILKDDGYISVNSIKTTLLGHIFGRNIIGKKLNARFVNAFTKLEPMFNVKWADSAMTFPAHTQSDVDFIIDVFSPMFDNVQGLTIYIEKYFEEEK